MHTKNKIETFHPANRFKHGPLRMLWALCLLFTINAALPNTGLAAIHNYNSGISVVYSGEEGVDWAEEYFWYKPIEDDHKVVYIKAETLIQMEHNERNMRNACSGNYVPDGFVYNIGINGEDGIPNSGDEGVIRYCVDRDLQLRIAWGKSNSSGKYPTYAGPFTFANSEYEPGVPVVGTTGGQGANSNDRENYYYAGQVDVFGDEWHTIAFADDDEWLGCTVNQKLASDGKTILFVVNPKTPCISFEVQTSSAQFYTTPPKAYWVPKVHTQTTYLTDNVEIKLVNIMGGNISYRINGGSIQAYSSPINSSALGNGDNIIEYWYNDSYHKTRKIVKNPPFPSEGEEHGYMLWKNDAEFNAIKSRLQTGSSHGYADWYSRIRASGDGDFNRNGHRDIIPGIYLGQGQRVTSYAALENAFVASVEGMDYTWTGEQDSFADYGKRMLLDNVRVIEPMWFGDAYDFANPTKEILDRGYFDVLLTFSNAFAYDLLIKDFKSTQHPDGITPIEDYKIRDSLAKFAIESMMQLGNYGEYGVDYNSEGMWGMARNCGSLVVALVMPSYDTHYYGTSGFDGTVATHAYTPYPDYPVTWKEAFHTETNPLYTYPNQCHRFDDVYIALYDTRIKEILEEPVAGYPPGTWCDRIGYFSRALMGRVLYITANAMKIKLNHTYTYWEMAFDYANQGTLYGLKEGGPERFPQLLLINERFPNLAADAEAYLESNPYSNVDSIWGQMSRLGIYSLIFYNDNWEESSQAPNADAGVDQTVTDSDGNGSEQVTLDGSGSSDADGTIVSYVWSEDANQIATGQQPTVSLNVGTHNITLTVTDDGGLTDTDTVTITNEGTDGTPPSIVSVSAQENSVEITFNEPLNLASAENTGNYSIDNGTIISDASLDTDLLTVALITTAHTGNVLYTLTLSSVEDLAGNALPSTVTTYQYNGNYNASSVTQFGITWTFDRDYQVGQFANGDYWVVPDTPQGTVTIVSISPAPVGGRNGFEINPMPVGTQPYDNRVVADRHPEAMYDGSLQPALPVLVSANSSVVSTISQSTPTECTEVGYGGWRTYDGSSCALSALRTAAVITVLGEAPPDNGATVFRPPYVGTDKPLYSSANLRDDLLLSLPPVGSPPSMAEAERMFERVWLDHIPGWGGRTIHPTDNMRSDYGAGISRDAGVGALRLLLDDSIEDKQTLLIRYVQTGIDLYGMLENGMYWQAEGGHMSGRKYPILFAGLMLDDQGMLGIGSLDLPHMGFQEDCQTYYDDDPNYRYYHGILDYPRWGIMHCWNPDWGDGDSEDQGYRFCCTSTSWVAQTLAARLLGLQDEWNHPAYFDYMDRWMIEDALVTIHGSQWANDMWNEYRLIDLGTPHADAGTDQIVTDSDDNGSEQVTLDGSGSSDSDGTIINYTWSENGNQIATGNTPTVTLPIGEHTITLTVTDNDDLTDTDTVDITVEGPDEMPPQILSVNASETAVVINFSEPLVATSAELTNNYSINNGISITAASLDTDTVTLTTSAHAEGSYTLTVANVQDTSGNPMTSTTIGYEYHYGLVAHWKFDDGSGNTAADSSGNGNTGTLRNGPIWTTGKINGALSFDGTNQYVEIGAQDIVSPWTASFWLERQDSSNSNAALLDSPNYSLKLEQYPNLNNVGVSTYGVADHIFNYEAPIGNWAHLVFVGTQTQVALYVDGALEESIAASISCPMAQISSVSRAVNGTIDEVRVYNRALTAAEILELYDAGSSDPVTHTLGVTAVNGSVTKTPDKASYNHNEEVTLLPEPNTGYSFVNWSGDLTGSSNPATIVMDADKLITANFTITVNTYTLNITASDGSVTKTPDQATYDNGTTVTLRAMANTGYSFASWSGDASGTTNPTTVVMDGNKSVTANFTINTYTLDITATNGSVAKTPDQASYNHGTTVTLRATANIGYTFTGWSGDASGTTNPTTVVMDGNKSITANFTINTYTMDITAINGSVAKTPDQASYNHGTTVTLRATANTNYTFASWSGDASGTTNPTTVVMDGNKSVTANFTVGPDETEPTVTQQSPAPDSIQVSLNSLISLHVVDAGDGVDPDSVIITVNGDIVYTGNTADYISNYGHCKRTGTNADYTFTYDANDNFDFDQQVNVTVNAVDLAANRMDPCSYSFDTEMRSFGENKKVNSSSDDLNKGSPATVRDSIGNIWAAWHVGAIGSRNIDVGKLTTGADNFGNSIKVRGNYADQCNPVIAIDSDDKLYVAWQDNRRGNWDIYISTSNDGTNWSAETRVTDSNDHQINPAIVVNSSNNAYIVWEDNRNGNQDIYIATLSDGFSTKTQITSDSSDQVEPAIAADSDNTTYVVWTDTRNSKNDIYGAASNNGTWTNVAIVNNANNQSNPAIATESEESVLHLLWVDDTPGDNNDIFYAQTGDGLPGSPLTGSSIIDDPGENQLNPVIAVIGTTTDSNLHVFACWQDERGADDDLYFVEISSDNGTNVFVDDDGTNSDQTEPAIGIDGDGHPYLVWTDNRNTNTDIYYAGSTFIESDALASGFYKASDTNDTTVGNNPPTNADDVSVVVPAGAYPFDIEITISRIKNHQQFNLEYIVGPYEFSPSGLEFIVPVTITIPYEVTGSENVSYTVYWYNPLTNTLSQEGITDIQTIVISSTLHAVRFKTTHFTQFLLGGVIGGVVGGGGGGGGGGCSMSPDSQASTVEFLLPYIGLTVTMVVLKLKDKWRRKARQTKKSEC
jgi:uncharacterized repeat protein (TIGR02543 family)